MLRSRLGALLIATVAAASVSVTVVITYAVLSGTAGAQPAPEPLPRLYPAPRFELTTRDEGTLTTDDLKGKVWVVDVFFTSCQLVCPALTANMASIDRAVNNAGLGDDVQLVSITVDPNHDTPAVLRDYAAKFNADENWHFLTGDETTIHKMIFEGFKLSVEKTPQNQAMPVQHSPRMVLIDREGMIRGYYQGLDAQVGKSLLPDIQRLVDERP